MLAFALLVCSFGALALLAPCVVARRFERLARTRSAATTAALAPAWRPTLIVALGCPPRTRVGRPSRFLAGRAEAAAAAYHALGEIPVLCSGRGVVGRGERAGDDEVEALARLLERADVPRERIVHDRAARRTIDSIDFLAANRPDERILLVSQPYHLPRVLYLARARGLDAWGLAAPGPEPGRRERVREALGRLKAVLEIGLGPRSR